MLIASSHLARAVALLLSFSVLSACGLPRSGPNKNEIFAGSVTQGGDAYIIEVTSQIADITRMIPTSGFGQEFMSAGLLGSDTIRPGDVLSLIVYENVDDGLLVGAGQNATALSEIQVDGNGFIFVPYAGRIRAAGNSPEAIRRIITERLEAQTPDPQVLVQRVAGDGATVTVLGGVGAQGNYTIDRPTRSLTTMLAQAGGVVIPVEAALVTIVRGGRRGTIWLQDLYSNPGLDIALRNGDRIVVEEDDRDYTALGATGVQTRVPFETQELSAMEALSQIGGLQTTLSDPTGDFIFRNEPAGIAQQLLGRVDLSGPQRMVYVLDLTKPNGIFEAREFQIRDGDTIYVTEAPYSQFRKILSAITGAAGSAQSLSTVGE